MIKTPFGEVQTPMAILPYFYCPKCNVDVNIGDCDHSRKSFAPPRWIKQYALWRKGKFEVFEELLEKFKWLKNHAVVFSDGFEDDYLSWVKNTAGSGILDRSTEQAKEGTYSSKSTQNAAENNYAYASKALTNSATMYCRFYIYVKSGTTWDSDNVGWYFGQLSGDGPRFIIKHDGAVYNFRSVELYNASWYVDSPTGTISLDTWTCIELGRFENSSTGWIKEWKDGTSILNITDVNTRSGYNTVIRIGTQGYSARTGNNIIAYFDSVIIDNADYIGPIQKYAFIL